MASPLIEGEEIDKRDKRETWLEELSHGVTGDPGRAVTVLSTPGSPSPFTHTGPVAILSNDSDALEKPGSMHAYSLMENPRAL